MKKTLLSLLCYCLLINLNTTAQTGWQWGIRNTGRGGMEAWPTAVDLSGNVYASGFSYGYDSMVFGTHKVYNPSHYDQLLITKADPSGNFLWAIGGQNSNASINEMATDASGNLFIVGSYANGVFTLGTVTLTGMFITFPEYFIAKISSSGTVLWANNIMYASNPTSPYDFGVGVDASGNAYITGNFYQYNVLLGSSLLTNHDPTGFTCDVFLAKYSPSGVVRWAKGWGGSYDDFPFIGSGYTTNIMRVTPNGHIYIIGEYHSDSLTMGTTTLYDPYGSSSLPGIPYSYIAKFDSNGNNTWAKNIERHVKVTGLATNPQEQLFITGELDTAITFGVTPLSPGAVIGKFDSTGNNSWIKSESGGVSRSIAADLSGNLVWSGPIYDSMNFSGHILDKPAGSVDPIFVALYDTSGNYKSSVGVRSGGDDQNTVTVDYMGNYYLVGDYLNTPLVFGPSTLDTVGIMSETIYIAKYKYISPTGTSLVNAPEMDFMLYPNPAGNLLTISAADKINSIVIYDVSGRMVYSKVAIPGLTQTEESARINIASMPSGVYIVRVNDGTAKQFIKQ